MFSPILHFEMKIGVSENFNAQKHASSLTNTKQLGPFYRFGDQNNLGRATFCKLLLPTSLVTTQVQPISKIKNAALFSFIGRSLVVGKMEQHGARNGVVFFFFKYE